MQDQDQDKRSVTAPLGQEHATFLHTTAKQQEISTWAELPAVLPLPLPLAMLSPPTCNGHKYRVSWAYE